MVLNASKIMVVDCYVGAYFSELCVHDNPQDNTFKIVGLYL